MPQSQGLLHSFLHIRHRKFQKQLQDLDEPLRPPVPAAPALSSRLAFRRQFRFALQPLA